VRITPRHDGGLLGGAEVAWDAEHGVPLRAAVYANAPPTRCSNSRPTDVSVRQGRRQRPRHPRARGRHVVDLNPQAAARPTRSTPTDRSAGRPGQGRLHHRRPDALVGLPRKEVRLVELDGTPGALVTYGQGLGGIAVLESPSKAQPQTQSQGRDGGGGLSLPKISINGASGQELDTALGTVVRFDRAGVGYIVAGSVPPTAAEAAARGL
jgi:hypothetical protein